MLSSSQQLMSDVVVPATDATLFSDDWLWTGRLLLSTTLAVCCVCHVNVAVVAYIKQGFQTCGECAPGPVRFYSLRIWPCKYFVDFGNNSTRVIPLDVRLFWKFPLRFAKHLSKSRSVCLGSEQTWCIIAHYLLMYSTDSNISCVHTSSCLHIVIRLRFVVLTYFCKFAVFNLPSIGADCPVAALHRVW